MLLKIPPLHVIAAHFSTNRSGDFVLPGSTIVIWGPGNEKNLAPRRLLEISDTPTSDGDYIQINRKTGGAILIMKDFYEFCMGYASTSTIKHLGRPHVR